MKCATAIICLITGITSWSIAEPSPTLRVWKVYDDSFDLTLTSIFRLDGNTLKASFNHRKGQTFFASENERIGPYVVHKLTSSGKNSAQAVLHDTRSNEIFELSLNHSPALPGLRAQIADLANAQLWDVRAMDQMPNHGLTISSITSTGMTALTSSGTVIIPPISDAERTALESSWHETERQIESARARAQQAEAERKAQNIAALNNARQIQAQKASPRLNIEMKTPPRFFFGTEYRVPTGYAYYYTLQPTPGGLANNPQVIALPTGFETRMSGWSVTVER